VVQMAETLVKMQQVLVEAVAAQAEQMLVVE
jgi:hypothetical protein